MAKLTLEDIVPLRDYEKLAESAGRMASLDESKLILLTQFLDENKEKLEQDIDISKIYDSRTAENKIEFYSKRGIFLSIFENHLSPQISVLPFSGDQSSSYRENEFFYLPSEKDFLKTEKNCFHYHSCFYSYDLKETTAYEKPGRAQVIRAVNLVKLARNLQEFLSQENKEKINFSRFYRDDWFREYERKNKR